MKKSFIFVGILMILPAISCEISYGQVYLHRPDYIIDHSAGGRLKFHRLPLTWDQAHLACHNDEAVLASPTNLNITKALTSLMVQNGVTTTPIFTGIRNTISDSVQKSVEGVPKSNTVTQTSENCVVMKADGTRDTVSCLDNHPFICFYKEESKPRTECGSPDTKYVFDNRTGNCYKVYQDPKKWEVADMICAEDGGKLAVINSQVEAEIIWELAKESGSIYSVMIGFRSINDRSNWRTVEGQTLEEAGYSRWFSGEPNNYNENCGSVIFRGSKEDGILNDVSCDMDLMFICEIEPNKLKRYLASIKPTTPEPQSQIQIENNQDNMTKKTEPQSQIQIENNQDNMTKKTTTKSQGVVCNVVPECDTLDTEYVLNNLTGSCYKVHHDQHIWTQAYEICAAEGGHLAVINSQEEAEVIWDLVQNSSVEYSIFIGYRAFSDHRIWITVQGQTLVDAGYNKWNYGEPNSVYENCGGLNGGVDHGILNDVGCEIELKFICEIEPRTSTYMEARN